MQPGFAEALRGAFDALAAPLTGAAAVNQWVAQETRDKIQSIVTEDVAAQVRTNGGARSPACLRHVQLLASCLPPVPPQSSAIHPSTRG